MYALNKWRDLTTKSTRWVMNETLNVLSALLLFWAVLNAWRVFSVSLSRFLWFLQVIFINEDELLYIVSSSILSLGWWQCRLNIAVNPMLPLLINAPLMLSRVDLLYLWKATLTTLLWQKAFWLLGICAFCLLYSCWRMIIVHPEAAILHCKC